MEHYSYVDFFRKVYGQRGRKLSFCAQNETEFREWKDGLRTALAEKMGIREELEGLGITIRAETCMIISPIAEWGFKVMMTDSGKCVHYGPMECGTEMVFGSAEECVESAVCGHVWTKEA